MNHPSAQCSRLVVDRTLLPEDAIKGPVDCYSLFAGVTEHPHEPAFYCATVEIFDDMQHFHDGLEKGKDRPVIRCEVSRNSESGVQYSSGFERFDI